MIDYEPLQDPDRARGEPARWLVGWAARGAAIALPVGTIVMFAAGKSNGSDWWGGFGLALLAVLVAGACIAHGRRYEHERGRGISIVTVLVGLLVVILAFFGHVSEPCGPGTRAVCLKGG